MIDTLLAERKPAAAFQIFEGLTRHVPPPTAPVLAKLLVRIKAASKDPAGTLLALDQYRSLRQPANAFCYNLAITACARTPGLAEGVYVRMSEDGVEPDASTWASLIGAASGDVALAERFAGLMEERKGGNMVAYNALVGVCAGADAEEACARALARMKGKGFAPNSRTYTPVLMMHGRAGNVAKARATLEVIKNEGLQIDDFHRQAGLLAASKAGDRDAALEFVGGMVAAVPETLTLCESFDPPVPCAAPLKKK